MKVYAEFIQENNISYRRKTLLQFGESINLIGSAVLMNPGSAKPKSKNINIDIIKNFYKENHNNKIELKDSWYSFSNDSTMNFLEKIFNGWYVDKYFKLNGIIQLFNCFYYRDQNLQNARRQFSQNSKYLFKESIFFKDKPVYFGWGKEGKSGVFRDIAQEIFSEYNHEFTPIYNKDFSENNYYHPIYVNCNYSKDELLKKFINDFRKLISE